MNFMEMKSSNAKETSASKKLKPIDFLVVLEVLFRKYPWLRWIIRFIFKMATRYLFADTDWEEIYDSIKDKLA